MFATGPRTIRFEAAKVRSRQPEKKAPIVVYVLDENGRGLQGAKVVFKNLQTGKTGHRDADSSGKCPDYWGRSGTRYLVKAEKAGVQFDPPCCPSRHSGVFCASSRHLGSTAVESGDS